MGLRRDHHMRSIWSRILILNMDPSPSSSILFGSRVRMTTGADRLWSPDSNHPSSTAAYSLRSEIWGFNMVGEYQIIERSAGQNQREVEMPCPPSSVSGLRSPVASIASLPSPVVKLRFTPFLLEIEHQPCYYKFQHEILRNS